MERKERDESSSKLEEALRELTGVEPTGETAENEKDRNDLDAQEEENADTEPVDVSAETACTDL